MPGISRAHERAPPQTQQVIFTHDAPHPLVICRLLAPLELGAHSPVTIDRHFNRYLLNQIPQLHVPINLLPIDEPVITCAAYLAGLTHLAHRQFALRFYFFFDFLVERAPPPAFSSSRCSS